MSQSHIPIGEITTNPTEKKNSNEVVVTSERETPPPPGTVRRPNEPNWRFQARRAFATRRIEDLLAETKTGGLKATLTWYQLLALGIGIIIGTGIFVYTGTVAANNTGPAISSAFVIAGAVSALSALSYSELASMIPVAGSAYTYAYATLGELIAWIIGWNLILEYMAGSAAVAVGWSSYMVTFLERISSLKPAQSIINGPVKWDQETLSFAVTGNIINIPAVVIVLVIGSLLVIGTKESAWVTSIIVAIKVFVVLLFLIVCGPYVDTSRWYPYLPEATGVYGKFGVGGLFKGASIIFFAYIGFDSVSTAAQEARNPGRDMPIGILGSLTICTILYIAVSMVVTGIADYTTLGTSDPITQATSNLNMPWLDAIIAFGAVMGLTSVILVQIMGQARVFYSMGRDGLLPSLFYKVHPRFGTPWLSTILIMLVVAIMAAVLPTEFLGEMTSVGTLTAFFFVNIGVAVLRFKAPDHPRRFKVPFGPYVIPPLGALSCLFLIGVSSVDTIYRLLGWIAIGIIVYLLYGRRYSKLNHPEKWANIDLPPAMEAH